MDVSTYTLIFLVIAALTAGWADSVVGGGGLIQLPALLVGLPEDTPVTTISGTNKISSAAGTLIATATYLSKVKISLLSGVFLGVGGWIGSAAGARFVEYVPKQWFSLIVLVVVVAIGIYTWRRPQLGQHDSVPQGRMKLFVALLGIGIIIGFYDGFLGPGTGMFFVIALVAWLGYGFIQASALAKLANLMTNLAAITVLSADILWGVGIAMAIANLTGGFLGARMALRYGPAFVRRVFLVIVVLLVLRLGWETVAGFF